MILVDLIDGNIPNHFIQNIMNLFQVENDLGRVGKEGGRGQIRPIRSRRQE